MEYLTSTLSTCLNRNVGKKIYFLAKDKGITRSKFLRAIVLSFIRDQELKNGIINPKNIKA